MKDDLNKQDEALEALLRKVQNPQAPGWFEAKTLARLRREREKTLFFAFPVLRYLGVTAAAFALLALMAVFGARLQLPREASLANKVEIKKQGQDEQFFAALDAFDSYTRQAEEWNQEPY